MSAMVLGHHGGLVPKFSRAFGLGINYGNLIYDLPRHPSARRIRVDFAAGANSNVGLLYVVNTIAGARALMRSGFGDRTMFKGGSTIAGQVWGECLNMAGLSLTYPSLFGTYDPTDVDNEAKDNKLYANFDTSGMGSVATGTAVFTLFNPGDFFVYSRLKGIGSYNEFGVDFIYMLNARNGVLFDRILTDGLGVDMSGRQTSTGDKLLITGITSSGTTATATCASTATLSAAIATGAALPVPDVPWMTVYGAAQTEYNGNYQITVTSGTTFTYTFAGSATTPATTTGVIRVSLPLAYWPDSDFVLNFVQHRCGYMYGNAPNGGNEGNFQTRRPMYQEVAMFHGGWGRIQNRNIGIETVLTASGCSTTGTTLTMPDTSLVTLGMRLAVTNAGTGSGDFAPSVSTVVKSITDATHIVLSNVPASYGGTPLTPLVGRDVTFQRTSATNRNHNGYEGQSVDNGYMFGCMSGFDSSNYKLTGGPWLVEDMFHNRSPMGFLTDPNGNINGGEQGQNLGYNAYFPRGAAIHLVRETVVEACDITIAGGDQRGWGSQIQSASAGSNHCRTLNINQTNVNQTNLRATGGDANGRTYACFVEHREVMQLNWAGTQTGAIANTTKKWSGCVTEDAAGVLNAAGTGSNGNLNRTAYANAALNSLTSLNFYQTFRLSHPLLSTVAAVNGNAALADKIATEQAMWEVVCSPAGREVCWPLFINQHFRAPANV